MTICHRPLTTGYWVLLCCVTVSPAAAQSTSLDNDSTETTYSYTYPKNLDDSEKLTKPIPHPFVYLGPSLMPGGYAPLAYRVEGGLDLESKHITALASAAYDNGHKTDDNDQPNPKGHDRHLSANAYYRTSLFSHPGWFFGMGWRWSQLSTTNYTKGGNRPMIGGGYDLYAERPCEGCWLSMRLTLDWVMAGSDWQNGSHGPDIGFIFPRPTEKRHWFFSGKIGVYRFHTTVTEPQNIPLTRWQRSQRYFDGSSDLGVMYRF